MKQDPENMLRKLHTLMREPPWAPCLTSLDWDTHKVDVGSNAQKHLRPFAPKESQFSNRRIKTLLKLLRLLHLGATRAQASLNNYPRSPRGKWRWGWPSSLHLHSITLTLLKVLWVLVGPIFPHNIIRIHNTVTWDRQYSMEYSSHSGMNVRNILYNIVDPT
jgi:hypothetical protein